MLLVRNTTGSPIALAMIPARTVAANGMFDITGETAGFGAPEWAALEAQRVALAGGLVYWWSMGQPERSTGTLVVTISASTADIAALNTEIETIVAPGDVHVYADAVSGSDLNPGTVGSPVQTLTRALALLPVAWPGKCRIHLASGSYQMPLRWNVGGPVAGGQRLLIQGTLDTVLGPRTISGVSVDANNRRVITDATMALTPGAHRGQYVEFLSGAQSTGPGEGWRYGIVDNDATSLTLMLNGDTPPAPGDTFRIAESGTVLSVASGASPVGCTYTGVMVAFRDCVFDMDPGPFQYENDCSVYMDTCRLTSPALTYFRVLGVANGELCLGALRNTNSLREEFDDFPNPGNSSYANGPTLKGVTLSANAGGYIKVEGAVFDGLAVTAGLIAKLSGVLGCTGLDALGLTNANISADDGGHLYLGSGVVGAVVSRVKTSSRAPILVQRGGRAEVYNTQVFTTAVGGVGLSVLDPGSRAELVGITGPSPIANYGIEVLKGAYCKVDATTTVNGGLGNLIVDSIPGSYANNRVNGIRSNLGSQLDGGSPVLHSAGPHLNGGTAHNMSLVVQVAVGASSATVTNGTIRAASALRGTILQGQAGVGLQSVTPGAGSVTVTLSAPAAGTPVNVLVENIGN